MSPTDKYKQKTYVKKNEMIKKTALDFFSYIGGMKSNEYRHWHIKFSRKKEAFNFFSFLIFFFVLAILKE